MLLSHSVSHKARDAKALERQLKRERDLTLKATAAAAREKKYYNNMSMRITALEGYVRAMHESTGARTRPEMPKVPLGSLPRTRVRSAGDFAKPIVDSRADARVSTPSALTRSRVSVARKSKGRTGRGRSHAQVPELASSPVQTVAAHALRRVAASHGGRSRSRGSRRGAPESGARGKHHQHRPHSSGPAARSSHSRGVDVRKLQDHRDRAPSRIRHKLHDALTHSLKTRYDAQAAMAQLQEKAERELARTEGDLAAMTLAAQKW